MNHISPSILFYFVYTQSISLYANGVNSLFCFFYVIFCLTIFVRDVMMLL